MTDSNRSINDVPGLVQERRRYEAWLAALVTRRESTPQHVFERVLADYQGRLDRVNERLASHRQAIEEARANVQSRVTLLDAEERLRRDERAELELRAHVGELIADDADAAFRAVDDALGLLVTEKTSLGEKIAELQALLDEGGSNAAAPGGGGVDAGAPVGPAGSTVPVQPAAPHPPKSHSSTPSRAAAAAPSEPAKADRSRPLASQLPDERSQTPRSAFDELAFLSSVVGQDNTGPIVERHDDEPLISAPAEDKSADNSLLAGVASSKHPTGEHPLAANVTANAPLVLRSSTTVEQTKTLKCNECGGMNYPTEWYCERCGAELAAL